MFEKHFIEAVTERDIDLLLLEELTASSRFRQWLVDWVFQDDQPAGQLVGVWHSISRDPWGESDLIYVDQDDEGQRAILIENKIDAPAQPEQAERYRRRGQAGIDEGDWYDFRTCLIAPRKYLRGSSNAAHYDAQISHEQVRNILLASNREKTRMQHKAAIINAAIDKIRRGYQPVPHPQVTEFWHTYWEYVQENYPQLAMREPGNVPENSDWPEFSSSELGKNHKIVHKLKFGHVELYFHRLGQQQDALALLNEELFGDEIAVAGTQKTAFVQIKVKSIDRFQPFVKQQEMVDEALQAAVKLLELFPKIKLPDAAEKSWD
jgi:hypothetical protein